MKELNSTMRRLPRAQEIERLFIERWNKINNTKLDLNEWEQRSSSNIYFSEYDVISNDKSTTFEIKEDIEHQKTGNLAIEFFSENGAETGINSTKADYWVTYLPQYDDFFIMSVTKLKDLISNNRYHRIVEGCGDKNKPTKCYLLNSIRLFNIFPTKQEFEQEQCDTKHGHFLSLLTK